MKKKIFFKLILIFNILIFLFYKYQFHYGVYSFFTFNYISNMN